MTEDKPKTQTTMMERIKEQIKILVRSRGKRKKMGWVLDDGWPVRQVKRIIVHCSDTVDGNARSIDRYHRNTNGWNEIGYHYVIIKNGEVEKGRDLIKVGAHVAGRNKDSIGICLIGKGGLFKAAQLTSLRWLVRQLMIEFGIPWSEIRCHYEFDSNKSCPDISKDTLLALLRDVG